MATFDVLLPVKNGIAYFEEALNSICNQTYQDWRMFVLDHGSTDGSLELAQAYAQRDSRIVVNSFPEAIGLSGLLNRGLDLCDCKYVLRQDGDDISMPNRMEVLANAFEDDKELILAGSLGDIIDGRGKAIGRIDMPTGPHGVLAGTMFRIPVLHPASAMRLSGLRRLGVRYGQDFLGAVPSERRMNVPGLAEDYYLFGQLALVAHCRNLDCDLIKFRWHDSNVSAAKSLDQLRVALEISRYLAESFSLMHGVPVFDPAPFCNHGERLIDIDGKYNFSAEYEEMKAVLTNVLPVSMELTRELAFRKVIAIRNKASMLARFLHHAVSYGTRQAERRTVKSWMIRELKRHPMLKLTATGLPT